MGWHHSRTLQLRLSLGRCLRLTAEPATLASTSSGQVRAIDTLSPTVSFVPPTTGRPSPGAYTVMPRYQNRLQPSWAPSGQASRRLWSVRASTVRCATFAGEKSSLPTHRVKRGPLPTPYATNPCWRVRSSVVAATSSTGRTTTRRCAIRRSRCRTRCPSGATALRRGLVRTANCVTCPPGATIF